MTTAPSNSTATNESTLAAPEQAFDAREFRNVLGSFTTGVTIITAIDDDGQPWGLTANSFSSVSLDPPLILWSQALTAPSHGIFRGARHFAINILAEDQIALSLRFSRAGKEKFAGLRTHAGLGGVPLIDGCVAHLECSQEQIYPGGDHAIFIGRVERFRRSSLKGLVFGQGQYLRAQPHEVDRVAPDLPPESRYQLRAVRMATQALADLSQSVTEPVAFALSVWGSYGPTVVHWETPRQSFPADLRTGVVCRLTTSATGLAFSAFANIPRLPEMIVAELGEDAAGLGDTAPRTEEDIERALNEFRSRGLARVAGSPDFESMYGGAINAICAPVLDLDGNMIVGLTASAPIASLDVDWDAPISRALRGAAESVSKRLDDLSINP